MIHTFLNLYSHFWICFMIMCFRFMYMFILPNFKIYMYTPWVICLSCKSIYMDSIVFRDMYVYFLCCQNIHIPRNLFILMIFSCFVKIWYMIIYGLHCLLSWKCHLHDFWTLTLYLFCHDLVSWTYFWALWTMSAWTFMYLV